MIPEPPVIDESALPPQLRRLARVLGWACAWKLINIHGGQRIKLPQHHDDVRLADIIGADGVGRLRTEFRDHLWLDVPKPDKVHQQVRNRTARELRARGATLNEIAVATGLSRRHVLNVCREVIPGINTLSNDTLSRSVSRLEPPTRQFSTDQKN